ncbi:MAG: TonB family protein [Planctomycetota bacterium]|nr:TonB family protein [Planctomycetota bacterium]
MRVAKRPRLRTLARLVRSFFASTVVHATVIGVACALGAHQVFGGGPEARTVLQIPLEVAAVEFPEEPEEPREIVEVPEERLPEPELVPVEWKPDPVVWEDPVFADWEPKLPALDALPDEDWSLEVKVAPPPVPVPATELEPEPASLVVNRTEPVKLEGPDPEYPRASIRLGEEGSVECRIHIAADGGVERVEVEHSSGYARLDEAAVAGLMAWRFRPATVGGVALATSILHRVSFQLGS